MLARFLPNPKTCAKVAVWVVVVVVVVALGGSEKTRKGLVVGGEGRRAIEEEQ